jgi:hypothetical protein
MVRCRLLERASGLFVAEEHGVILIPEDPAEIRNVGVVLQPAMAHSALGHDRQAVICSEGGNPAPAQDRLHWAALRGAGLGTCGAVARTGGGRSPDRLPALRRLGHMSDSGVSTRRSPCGGRFRMRNPTWAN